MSEPVSDDGIAVLWSLLSSEDATEREDHDHAKTTTTDHDAITNTNAAKDTQLLSLTTQQICEVLE